MAEGFFQGIQLARQARLHREKMELAMRERQDAEQNNFLRLLLENPNVKGSVIAPVVAPTLGPERIAQSEELVKVLRNAQERRAETESAVGTLGVLQKALTVAPITEEGPSPERETLLQQRDVLRRQVAEDLGEERSARIFEQQRIESEVGNLAERLQQEQELAQKRQESAIELAQKAQEEQLKFARANADDLAKRGAEIIAQDPTAIDSVTAAINRLPPELRVMTADLTAFEAERIRLREMTPADVEAEAVDTTPRLVKMVADGDAFIEPMTRRIGVGGEVPRQQTQARSVLIPMLNDLALLAEGVAQSGIGFLDRSASINEMVRRFGGEPNAAMAEFQVLLNNITMQVSLSRSGKTLTEREVNMMTQSLPTETEQFAVIDPQTGAVRLSPAIEGRLNRLQDLLIQEYVQVLPTRDMQLRAAAEIREQMQAERAARVDQIELMLPQTVGPQAAHGASVLDSLIDSSGARAAASAAETQRR